MALHERPSDLDPKSKDYASQLEQEILDRNTTLKTYTESFRAYIGHAYNDLVERVRDIEGAEVIELPGHDDEHFSLMGLAVKIESLQAKREVEDAEREQFRDIENEQRDYDDEVRRLVREIEDFTAAAIELTEVKPLNSIHHLNKFNQFYVIYGDKVYEASIDIDNKRESNLIENKFIQPSVFDGENLTKFNATQNNRGANVYLISNPVRAIPAETIFAYGSSKALRDNYQKNAERETEELWKMRPYDRLMECFKRSVKGTEGQR